MIIGYIKGQELQLKSELIVADTIDYLTAKFVFKTADWQGLSKWAHFKKGSTVYDIPLTADGITKDKHLNLSDGEWEVYLHGNAFEGGEVVERITTEVAKLTVKGTGSLNGEPFPEIPASETERINAELADHEERIDALEQGGGGIPDAPADGKQYARQDNEWTEIVGGGGTSDHTQLVNRGAANQHPMSAITGLETALSGKQPSGDYATTQELDELANIVDGKADAADIPSLDGYATEQWVENKGYLTEHQSLAAYRTAAAQDAIDNGKADKSDIFNNEVKDFTSELNEGMAIATNVGVGNIVDMTPYESTYSSVVVPCHKGDVFTLTGSGGSTPRLWCFVDKSYMVLSVSATNKTETDLELEATANGFLIANVLATRDFSLFGNVLVNRIDNLEHEKLNIAQGAEHANEFLVVGADGNVTTQSLPLYDGSVV